MQVNPDGGRGHIAQKLGKYSMGRGGQALPIGVVMARKFRPAICRGPIGQHGAKGALGFVRAVLAVQFFQPVFPAAFAVSR